MKISINKRKTQERILFLKSKREKIKLQSRLEKLNSYTSKRNISDKSYNGAVPMHIAKRMKKQRMGSLGTDTSRTSLKNKINDSHQTSIKAASSVKVFENSQFQNDHSYEEKPYEYVMIINHYRDTPIAQNLLKYQSQKNVFRRRENSIDELRESLRKQIEDIGISVNESLANKSQVFIIPVRI